MPYIKNELTGAVVWRDPAEDYQLKANEIDVGDSCPVPVATKAEIWAKIKAIRDHRKISGVKVKVGSIDKWFHSDDASRIQQMALVMMGSTIPADLQWKTMDGSFITMTQAVARGVFDATAISDQLIFAAAEMHRVAMGACVDPSNYDYSTGWPVTYGG